ncbi:hypothetical protein RRF57_009531 [Xylaria bambusicola]|uniref:Protein kinase domain-containing protein n=1 Tax=Xylaria bambusicola TaxID=326684 RepID=A0AAN7Z915_9PEZI
MPPQVPWGEMNEVALADMDPGETSPSLSPCDTSTIADGSDSKQLPQTSTNDKNGSDCHQTAILSSFVTEQDLDKSLRIAMVASAIGHSGQQAFVPSNDLDRVINTTALSWELKRLRIVSNTDPNYYTNQICGIHEGESPQGKRTKTSRRRIFAILVLIELTSAILDIIREGIYDWDLPMTLNNPKFPQLFRRRGGEELPVTFSKNWPSFKKEAFFRCQWQLSSPYLEMRTNINTSINHYQLDQHIILPITSIGDSDRHGGFGSVRKIEIHPAHRNSLTTGSKSCLALKKLHRGIEGEFWAEVHSLKRLRKDHPHLIQLLATCQHGHDYYLFFPWADGGNLDDFFKSYLKVDFPPRDLKLSKWLASQLSGLSDALASIHKCKLDASAVNMSGFKSEDARKIYGTHGDLKPENILWFKRNDTGGETRYLGEFKISDFGLTSFHGLESRNKFEPRGYTATYRAPEYDIQHIVSQKYDMWSFGGVLTELATWYLRGGDAVTAFRMERLEDTIPGFKEDIFFSLPNHQRHNPIDRATEKASVRKHLNMLRNQQGCTEFFLELINFVDDHLLRMQPFKRCRISELQEFISSLNQKCHEDDNYCIERITPVSHRRGTNLSELLSNPTQYSVIQASSSRGSSMILSTMSDKCAARHSSMLQKSQDSLDRTPSIRSSGSNLEVWQNQRPRAVSTVKEIETPVISQHHEEISGQHDADTASLARFGSTNDNAARSDKEDAFSGWTATFQRSRNAQCAGPIQQTEARSLHQNSDKSAPAVTAKALEGESYSASESCCSLGRTRAVIVSKWSMLLRRLSVIIERVIGDRST